MSRTHKDKPTKILYPEDASLKPRRVDTEWHWRSATPSWWTNLFMNRPQRKQAQQWSQQAKKTKVEDLEELDTPNVSHKPHKYYW